MEEKAFYEYLKTQGIEYINELKKDSEGQVKQLRLVKEEENII